jgi:hypothetical protein
MKELHATIAEQCARVARVRERAEHKLGGALSELDQTRRRCDAAEKALRKIARAALRDMRQDHAEA